MRAAIQCLPCFIDDIVGALEILAVPPKLKRSILTKCLSYLSNHVDDTKPPSYHITALHRILKRTLGMAMPFSEARTACLRAGKVVARTVESRASALSGFRRFRFLTRWAIAANSLDFRTAGAGYSLSIAAVEKTLRRYFRIGLCVDLTQELYDATRKARNVVYVPDNVGELPFDKLLIGLISSYGISVTVPLRGGPITSDAVMADARAAGIHDVSSRVILSGPDTLGISFAEMSKDLARALARADVIIAKGQANYYVLSEFGARYPDATVACLLTAKCSRVWTMFGCTGKSSVAAIIKHPATKQRHPV